MRILMTGLLSVSYIRDNWVEPLRRMHEVTCVDLTPLLSIYQNGYHEKYLLSLIQRESYDCLFFYSDAVHQEFSDDFFYAVRRKGLPIIAFYADDEPEIWFRKNAPYDHRFDFIATHSRRGAIRRQQEGWQDRVLYLPWGYNPRVFYKIPKTEKKYDVIYVGANVRGNNNIVSQSHQNNTIQRLMVEMYRFCQSQGLIFRIFGDAWDKDEELRECYGGRPSFEELAQVYNETRIVFNPGISAEGDDSGFQTKLRHFEVAGCGSVQITNRNPELMELFVEDKEILFYDSLDGLKSKVLTYVRNEKIREEMALKTLVKAKKEHTTDERLKILFNAALDVDVISMKSGTTISQNTVGHEKPLIKTVWLKERKDAQTILEQWNDDEFDGFDAVHFIVGDLQPVNIEYNVLSRAIQKVNAPIIGVRSFLELAILDGNFVQRRKQNIRGLLLKERNVLYQIDEAVGNNDNRLGEKKEIIPAFIDGNLSFPIFNYLVRPNIAKNFLQASISNDVKWFLEQERYESGMILNDLRVNTYLALQNWEPAYISRLRMVLNNIQFEKPSLMVYGVQGKMAEHVFKLLKEYPNVIISGLIDRSLTGSRIQGHYVYSADDILKMVPDYIIIAAEHSGPQILNSIRDMQAITTILPLYNLDDPVWELFL
ncbi:glycosyltransferase [Heliobacillus mobilis]|uniref:Glycosyltransferase n=1 Tax=Heliobacterium mobile TaxID=28064 RepID=A0A6I3SL80_HELMO|nr:glycosyltransferase [Heliobacterium mobile]MTV49664.1 glycosyltransferase [Heliobacterium mobile]